jgi:Flp pilus assembly pilin Flp
VVVTDLQQPWRGQQAMIDAAMYLYMRGRAALTGRDEGATMIEYILMIVAIAIVVFIGANALGNRIDARFDGISP